MKICSGCKIAKPLDEFGIRKQSKDGRNGRCKECRHTYDHHWHKKRPNPEKFREQVKRNSSKKLAIQDELICARLDIMCPDCGIKWPVECMDFDHVRGVKIGDIGYMRGRVATTILIAEMDKCEVVCSNCHRIRTARRAGWRKGPASSDGRTLVS